MFVQDEGNCGVSQQSVSKPPKIVFRKKIATTVLLKMKVLISSDVSSLLSRVPISINLTYLEELLKENIFGDRYVKYIKFTSSCMHPNIFKWTVPFTNKSMEQQNIVL